MILALAATATAHVQFRCAMFIDSFAKPALAALFTPFIVLIERRAAVAAQALAINARCAGTRTRRQRR